MDFTTICKGCGDVGLAGQGLFHKLSVLIWSGSSSISAKSVMGVLCHRWSMKGGGNDSYAQGGPYPVHIDDAFNALLQLVEVRPENYNFQKR